MMPGKGSAPKSRLLRGPAACAAGGFLLFWSLECAIAVGTGFLIEPRMFWDPSSALYWSGVFLVWMAPLGGFLAGLGLLLVLRAAASSS